MKNKDKGIDATPGGGEENGFFSDFFEGEDALAVEETDEELEEEDEASAGGDDQGDDTPDEDSDEGSGGADEDNDDDDQNDADEEEDEDSDEEDESDDESDDKGGDDDDKGAGDTDFGTTMSKFVESGILDVVDENKEYSNDEEGFQELVKDTVQARLEAERAKMTANRDERVSNLEQFLAENPEADVVEWAESQNEFDYNAVDHTDAEHAEYLLEDYLQLQGYPEDEARQTIEGYKKLKSLGKHALRAKQALIKYQEQQNVAKTQAKEQARIQREAAIKEQQRAYEQRILKTDKIAGMEVGTKERQELADYIMKPVDSEGNTQLMLDEKNNTDSDLLYALIQKRKLDLSKIERKAETKATLKFKKKLDKHTDKAAKARPNHEPSHQDESGEIDDSVLDTWNM